MKPARSGGPEPSLLEFAKKLEQSEPSLSFALQVGSALLGEDLLAVLRAVESAGTLKKAAELMGSEYSSAWRVLSSAELALKTKLVERSAGGYGGGGAFLTPYGALVLGRLEYFSRKLTSLLKDIRGPAIRVYGSDCPGARLILDTLWERGISSAYAAVGSWNGLELLSAGLCEAAGIHLPNPGGDGYNTFLLRDERFRDRIAIVRGYVRRLGFVVRRGNPKSIKSFRDLLRPGVIFANRNKGSGTRAFIDEQLRVLASQEGIPLRRLLGSVKGYRSEHLSHVSVAYAVASGRADVGVALEWAAKLFNLDFIPLREESYDFAVLRESVHSKTMGEFLEAMRSEAVRSGIKKLGFSVPSDMGEVFSQV